MARLSLPFPVHCSCSHRRLLHEPLVPVDWNAPPSPSLEVSYPQSTLPLPPPTGPVDISSGTNQAHRIKGSAVIGIAVSVMLLGILSFCAFLVYRRLNRRAPESERLVGGGRGPRFEAAPAARQPLAPVALYLGTEAPAVGRGRSREQRPGGGSPYEKLRASARQLPSPELHPLPALHPSARNSESAVASLSSDEYYTPNRSAAGESPSSVTSAVGKDIPVCAVDRRLRSRRLSPRSRLSNSSSSDVKRVVVAQSARPPPPPPPPPPPKPKAAPAVPSLPTEVPVRPSSSRRQWVKPASQADVPVPVAENPSVAKPRLKPLHWDKVRASSDREMVWDQLKSNSFQLDEDMFVMLFCNSANGAGEGLGRRPAALSSRQENHRVLDPKKSQNIAILLRALNVTVEEVTEALLEGDPEGLGTELLETLVKMAPSKEEELRLKDFSGDISKLGSAELFLKAILDIPFAFQRVDAMLYRANFDSEVDYLRKSFKTLEVACDELKGSRLFLKLLEAVLRTGNRMNVGTNRGEAKAFKLDALLKLADVKGVDGKITLLHFVVQEIIRSEGSSFTDKTTENSLSNSSVMHEDGFKKEGLRVVAGLGKEFVNLKLAASMDSSVLSSYVSKLESGLDKIKSVLQLGRVTSQGRFFESMNIFLGEAEKEVARVKAEEKSTFTLVKEITEYFHGNAAKEEAHPFRIFMVVRDFLTMLDNVCREVERMQTTAVVGSARSFRMSTSVSLPVLNRFEKRRDESSGDESSSS